MMRACIERVISNRVGGWAYNDSAPDQRLAMALLLDGQVIAEVTADNFRNDLKLNGLGDGYYGFEFADVPIADLPNAYLSGRIDVRATGNALPPVLARPAAYLRQHVERFLRSQVLDFCSFSELLASVAAAQSPDAESAGHSLDLLNASRARFSEWPASIEFLKLSGELAAKAGRPHSRRFYETQLRRVLEPDAATPKVPEPVTADALPATYGSLQEWCERQSSVDIEIVKPRFFLGGRSDSFLQDVGILKDGPAGARKVRVLAFREYSFADPTWWVMRNGIRTFAARNLYYLDFEILRSVVDQGGFVLIDMSNEGPPADPNFIMVLNNALLELQVDPQRVILVTQNLRFGRGATQNKFLGHVAVGHYYISKSIQVLATQLSTESQLAQHCHSILSDRRNATIESLRHYICLNFTPRWPRWATVLHLSLNGLLGKGYVSFPGKINFKLQVALDLEEVIPQLARRRDLLQHAAEFVQKCPLELDIPSLSSTAPEFVFPLALTTRSLFHVVTESEMSDGEQLVRVTEKVLKPIVGLQPFIVVGNPGSLALLRDMGFRTFGSLIDEAYDSIADPARRLDAVFEQIDRLTNLPINSLREMVEGLNEILVHNLLHLMLVGPLLFNNAVENRLRRLIASQLELTEPHGTQFH